MLITLYLGFFSTTYEEFVLGEMHLGVFNGPDEGNFMIATGSLISFILGCDFWIYRLKYINMTIGELIIFSNFIGSFFAHILPLFYHVFQKKGINKIREMQFEFLLYCNIILFPGVYLFLYKEYYSKNLTLIIFFISILYSKIIINLQIIICTGDKSKYFIDIIISNILIIINYFVGNEKFLIFSSIFSIIFVGSNLVKLIYIRANEILNYLNIRFLVIPYKKDEKRN